MRCLGRECKPVRKSLVRRQSSGIAIAALPHGWSPEFITRGADGPAGLCEARAVPAAAGPAAHRRCKGWLQRCPSQKGRTRHVGARERLDRLVVEVRHFIRQVGDHAEVRRPRAVPARTRRAPSVRLTGHATDWLIRGGSSAEVERRLGARPASPTGALLWPKHERALTDILASRSPRPPRRSRSPVAHAAPSAETWPACLARIPRVGICRVLP